MRVYGAGLWKSGMGQLQSTEGEPPSSLVARTLGSLAADTPRAESLLGPNDRGNHERQRKQNTRQSHWACPDVVAYHGPGAGRSLTAKKYNLVPYKKTQNLGT